jgi:hypothetical protein
MIKNVFLVKPEVLNASEKNLTFAQIIKYVSINDVKEYIIEKELDSILRKSHSEHFEWLENRLGMKLRENLPIWTTFVELTERRNIFVHNDGIVNNQYLTICKENKVEIIGNVKQGNILTVTDTYFSDAYRCIFEIGIKLIHVIWRKINEVDRKNSDGHLTSVIYDLLVSEEYDLAIILSEFATNTIKKYFSEENRLSFILNKAQSYKWSGDNAKCLSIIKSIDWGAYGDLYKLGSTVLLDEFTHAALIMKRVGDQHEVLTKSAYRNWPLFKSFRTSDEFLEAFNEIFKENFEKKDQLEEIEVTQKQIAITEE